MTRDEILNMEGREIRLAVAKYVMGWKRVTIGGAGWWIQETEMGTFYKCETKDWLPDEDISAAWEVVEKLQDKAFYICISTQFVKGYSCIIQKSGVDVRVLSETAPLAICRAALLAFVKSDDE